MSVSRTNTLSTFARLVIVIAVLGASSATANILSNPGFEDGSGADATDWAEIANGANGTVARSSLMPNSGNQSAYIEFDNTGSGAAGAYFIEQNLGANTLDSAKNYDFSFFAKVDSTDFTGVDMFYQVQWLDQDNSNGGGFKGEELVSLIGLGVNDSYQQFGFSDVDVPDDADSYLVRFQVSAGAVADIVNGLYVDDVSLAEVTTAPPSTDFQWNATGFGDWNDALNWTPSGGPPGNQTATASSHHTATFGGAIAAPSTVIVDAPVTVNRINFDNVTNSYFIAGATSVSVSATTAGPPTNPVVDVAAGSHEFQLPFNLDADTSVIVASGATLAFNHALNLNGHTLTKTGDGNLAVNNVLNSAGGSLSVMQGTLSGAGTVGGDVINDGGTISPGAGALEQNVQGVPEATSFVLLALGTLGICCTGRWRKRKLL